MMNEGDKKVTKEINYYVLKVATVNEAAAIEDDQDGLPEAPPEISGLEQLKDGDRLFLFVENVGLVGAAELCGRDPDPKDLMNYSWAYKSADEELDESTLTHQQFAEHLEKSAWSEEVLKKKFAIPMELEEWQLNHVFQITTHTHERPSIFHGIYDVYTRHDKVEGL